MRLYNPNLKRKDIKKGKVFDIDIESYPDKNLNIVAELISPDFRRYMNSNAVSAPLDSDLIELRFGNVWVLLTILGHSHNLLVTPNDDGFHAKHYNSRFSANRKGVKYEFEAYGK